MTRSLCTQIDGQRHVVRLQRRLQCGQHHTGLACHNVGVLVDGQDAIHARQREDNLVKHGHGAAHEARVAALRNDGQFARVAVLRVREECVRE